MRFILVFTFLGLILTAVAAQQARQAAGIGWVVVAVEADLAVCLFALATIYALRAAGMRVEEFSRRPGWSLVLRIILLPYLILGRAALFVARWLDRKRPFDPLAPGLFIGRLPFPSERSRLQEAGIDAVLSLCWEFPGLPPIDHEPRCESGRVPILDGSPPTDRQFEEAVQWVADRRAEGRCILIHCAQGHGRTATVTTAVLVRLGLAADIEQALAMVRAARPLARPSRVQKAALMRYLTAIDQDAGESIAR